MPGAAEEFDRAEVSGLLAGAAKAMRSARFCWMATAAEEGGLSALRPMGRLPPEPGDSEWKLRFITDGRSGKAADIRRAGRVALIFQHDVDDAFVTLSGAVTLQEDPSEVRRRWKPAYDQFFPTETDRANAAFLEVEAEHMDLWIRGVTPEPFGMQTTRLERDAGGIWRPIGADRKVL